MYRPPTGEQDRFSRRLITYFCVSIAALTLLPFILRLTLFPDTSWSGNAQHMFSDETMVERGGSESLFVYTMRKTIYFPAPREKGEVFIDNVWSNQYWMNVELYLYDDLDGEAIARIPAPIKPGNRVRHMALSAPLEDGVYDCIARISALDPGTGTVLNTQERQVTVYVGAPPS